MFHGGQFARALFELHENDDFRGEQSVKAASSATSEATGKHAPIGCQVRPANIRIMDDQRLGASLRAVRMRRRRRQSDVAAAAGVGQTTISRIERGHLAAQSLTTLRRVAAALDVRIEV